MNTNNNTQQLADSIQSAVFCELIDEGFSPKEAWDRVYEDEFDLLASVDELPVEPSVALA